MCKKCALVAGITVVALLGIGAYMYRRTVQKGTIVVAHFDEPAPAAQQKETVENKPYGCGAFMKDCVPGDVGGCEQYKQTCVSADNSVRLTMAHPGECDQFRRQCAMGDYVSCDLFNRACLYEQTD